VRDKSSALATYNQVANMETDPVQQIVMLYNGAIKFLRLAASDIEAKDLVSKAEHSRRALDIISYLQSTLSFERGQDAARVLDSLYGTATAMILRANLTLDAEMMRRTADLLAPVCEAWSINAHSAVARDGAIPDRGSLRLVE
jgi:flagellar protein FliS